jgi:hypothetical protein
MDIAGHLPDARNNSRLVRYVRQKNEGAEEPYISSQVSRIKKLI